MELAYIKKLIKLIENSGVDEIEVEEEGKKIRIAKHQPVQAPVHHISLPQAPPPAMPVAPPPTPAAAPAPTPAPSKAEQSYHEIRSPIVGTFYRAPSPDADPYVEVGHKIRRGSVLCIVEAMKLMNEIESDLDGEIVKILVENAKPVEYNQPLFLIKPS
ncbi:MAG: acetyl-CoA carboxylase biotin carboxyl carrier protein [Ignavibacteria bacterium]|nr:acetyl-CoA carboxylase biotin carboxyl carrier protein [Ignavibacteria bacterium]